MTKCSHRRGNLGEGGWDEEKVPQFIWTTRYGVWNLLNFEDEIHVKGGRM
jgi:hypothetical protein